ncbi:MAG: GerMN domain-containing protein [bacterium]|nr:GerMN domain-containing protein [bacterium]
MKLKIAFLVLLMGLSACNLNAPGQSPADPTITAEATPPVTVENPDGTVGEGETTYFLVTTQADEGSLPVGCEGFVTPFTTESARPDPTEQLRANLEALLSAPSDETNLNYLVAQNLTLNDVSVSSDGAADIALEGDLALAGECVDAQIEAQILLTVFAVEAVQQARITLNGDNLKQVFDVSGEVGAEAVYTEADVRVRE